MVDNAHRKISFTFPSSFTRGTHDFIPSTLYLEKGE
jgi:hypothetical protein